MESACLTCRHARKGKNIAPGQVLCFLSFQPQDVHHVCFDFESLFFVSHDVKWARAVSSCSASTTATNSHKQEFRGEF